MQKITGIIIALAVICLISAGFAIQLNDVSIENINTNSIAKADNIQDYANEVSNEVSDNDNQKDVPSNTVIDSIASPKKHVICGIEVPYEWIKIPNTKYAFLRDDLDYTDRYAICLECDKAFPLGKITKLIPEAYRYCDGSHIAGCLEYKNTDTYEDILEMGDYEKFFGHGPNEDAEAAHQKALEEYEKLEAEKNKDNSNPMPQEQPQLTWSNMTFY